MSFSRPFSAATWLWRRTTSRPARLLYLGVLVIVIVPGIALRVEAALFERRAHKVMSALSSFRIGVTPKAEVLSRMSGFRVERISRGNSAEDSHGLMSRGNCEFDECFWINASSPRLSDWVLRRAGSTGYETLFSVVNLLGFRLRSLDAYVNLNSGKVSGFGYRLVLSTPHADVPGAVIIRVSSRKDLTDWKLDYVADESPNYQVSHRKWPVLNADVYFTRDAPPALLSHAFDLNLQCVWSLRGCRTANELLPEAEQDRLRIEHAAFDRMNGQNQCPDWILPRRARDTENILMVEVERVSPNVVVTDYGAKYRLANFRLLRVVKGKAGRPLDQLGVALDTEIWLEGARVVHNSAIDLLNPGQKLLLFSGGGSNIFQPCEAVDATSSAIQTIERSLPTEKP